jgi:hypothetical protein
MLFAIRPLVVYSYPLSTAVHFSQSGDKPLPMYKRAAERFSPHCRWVKKQRKQKIIQQENKRNKDIETIISWNERYTLTCSPWPEPGRFFRSSFSIFAVIQSKFPAGRQPTGSRQNR